MNVNLEHLRKLAQDATPDWRLELHHTRGGVVMYWLNEITSIGVQRIQDAVYIAAASPDAILALIGEVERLRGQRDAARQQCLDSTRQVLAMKVQAERERDEAVEQLAYLRTHARDARNIVQLAVHDIADMDGDDATKARLTKYYVGIIAGIDANLEDRRG